MNAESPQATNPHPRWACAPARNALEVANILPLELELIVVATSTPDNVFPSTASLIQDQLGATRAGAFDLSAACAGFVYALNMAAQSIRSGSIESALVIGSETMSRIIDWRDRSICVLFGDGAGAVVLKASETEGGIRSAVLRSDGSGRDLLGLPAMVSPKHMWPESAPAGSQGHKMHMNGREVYRFATRIVGESISQALEKAQLDISDLSLIVPHQANFRIIGGRRAQPWRHHGHLHQQSGTLRQHLRRLNPDRPL